jgi:hypothetical protein
MMDITKLIDDYAIYWISREDTRNTEVRNKILSHISAMQEVIDKAMKHCKDIDCHCPLCEAVAKYEALNV